MIFVSPLSRIYDVLEEHSPSHLITLLDPETLIDTPPHVEPHRHLRVGINDIAEPMDGMVTPARTHVESIVDFVRDWNPDTAPMLVHCWAGISRSTATAYLTLCLHNEGREREAAQLLRERAPHAYPNRRIVAVADDILGRKGRMVEAIESIGRGEISYEGEVFSLPVSF